MQADTVHPAEWPGGRRQLIGRCAAPRCEAWMVTVVTGITYRSDGALLYTEKSGKLVQPLKFPDKDITGWTDLINNMHKTLRREWILCHKGRGCMSPLSMLHLN